MRIVVIGTDTLYSSIIAQRLIDEQGVVGVVITRAVLPGRDLLRAAVEITRRHSIRFFAYKTAETLLFRALATIGLSRPGLARLGTVRGVPVVSTKDLNGPRTLERIAALQPDLIVSINSSERFGRRLREIPSRGCINIHAAPLPRYRGLAPYFWMLLHGESETAVTVHAVDAGLDSGRILATRPIPIEPEDTAQSLFFRCCVSGADVLAEAVEEIGAGRAASAEQTGSFSYFSWPTKAAMRQYRKMGRRLWDIPTFIRHARSVATRSSRPS